MTLEQLIADVTTKLTRVGSNRISGPEVLQSVLNVISFFATQIASILPEWTNALTFNTDGSGAGKYCIYADTNGKKRIWETKTDGNINHLPPSDPLITENTYWIETSASAASSIQEWAAGLYGPGLVIVAHNHSVDGHGLYWLLEPARPFASTNIETEITAVKWVRLGGSSTGTGGPAIDEKYANIAAMLADQANQEEDALYFVLDASADATVDAGWALYQKLTATTGAIGDYRKLSEQESLDVIFTQPDASETVKGIVELATVAEATAGTDTVRAVTAEGVKASVLSNTPIQVAASDEITPLTIGDNKVVFRMPAAKTLTAVRASLTTAQASGSILTVDVHKNGASVLSTKITIDNTEKTSMTAATPAVISDSSLAQDDEIMIGIDQVGDGTACGLKITLI
jgi:hypothetical protein